MGQSSPVLTEQQIEELIEDAVASSAIEGYITPEGEQKQLKQWFLSGLSADEMVEEIKKDMGLKWNTHWSTDFIIPEQLSSKTKLELLKKIDWTNSSTAVFNGDERPLLGIIQEVVSPTDLKSSIDDEPDDYSGMGM